MSQNSEEYDPEYMLRQMERLQWENHQLRRVLIIMGADMDKINEMTGLEAWIEERKGRG